jgi:hypothetical protein
VKILINEALRLKNTIAAAVRQKQGSCQFSGNWGMTLVDGVVTDEASANVRFDEYLDSFSRLLEVSEEINSAIDRANKENGISDKARSLANTKLLVEEIGSAMPNCKARQWTDVTRTFGNDGGKPVVSSVQVKMEFIPWVTKVDLKDRLAKLRAKSRDLMNEISRIDNTVEIEVSFTYEEIESLLD